MADQNGPGWVYVLTYTSGNTKYYKIGCTSRDPEKRLEEIQRNERERKKSNRIIITLVGFAHVDHRRNGEAAAQQAVGNILKKDPNRKLPTDWFIDNTNPRQELNIILDKVRSACNGPVYKKNESPPRGVSWYLNPEMNLDHDQTQFSILSAKAVKKANAFSPTYYVYVMSMVNDGITCYTTGCTESDPDECLQETRGEQNNNDVKLVCFMRAKDENRALNRVKKAFKRKTKDNKSFARNGRTWYNSQSDISSSSPDSSQDSSQDSRARTRARTRARIRARTRARTQDSTQD